jgi:hypothetical protein
VLIEAPEVSLEEQKKYVGKLQVEKKNDKQTLTILSHKFYRQ